MGSLKDLGQMVDDGLVSVKKIQEKYKSPKTGQELAHLSKTLSDEIVSQYHEFAQDQMKRFDSKAEAAITCVQEMSASSETMLKKFEQISEDSIKNIGTAINSASEYVHEEKDRLSLEYKRARTAFNDNANSAIKQVQNSLAQVDAAAAGIETKISSVIDDVEGSAAEAKNRVAALVVAQRIMLVQEFDEKREQLMEDVLEYMVKNAGRIVWKWIKRKLRIEK